MIVLMVRRKSDGKYAKNVNPAQWGAGQPYPLSDIHHVARLFNKIGTGYQSFLDRGYKPGTILDLYMPFSDLQLVRIDLEAMTRQVVHEGSEIKNWRLLPRD